ncbi:MAG TPA: TonB-dependent receptor, partial [Acidobacteriaceae bacterium]|nr:TonB-dependent receptor [Acidobacteriaceae bacterium]
GGTLMGGWRGRALKEWTVVATVVAGSGLPETPRLLQTVNGTGNTAIMRPDRTSAPLYIATAGRFLNADAFTTPAAGQWGDAGRDSIIGPGTFTFNTSVSRTFRVWKKWNLDIRVDSTNMLNHPVFSAYNTVLNPFGPSPTFGAPASVAAMRSLQTTARLRF